MYTMELKHKIKILLAKKDMNMSDLAAKTGMTKQNLSNKLQRNDMRVSELENICNILDAELVIQEKGEE